MKKNIGFVDKIIRIIIGILCVLPILQYGFAGFWWTGIIGILLLITAFTEHCWIYSIFKISTRKG